MMRGLVRKWWLLAIVTFSVSTGPLLAAVIGDSGPTARAATAAQYTLTVAGKSMKFESLLDINTEVQPTEFVSNPGGPTHPKQFGKVKPPSVTFRMAIGANTPFIWSWHLQARDNSPAARQDAVLAVVSADGTTLTSFKLQNAWPSKVDIAGLKAGAAEVAVMTVKLEAESITMLQKSTP
jgi:phage tail-like protein